MARGRSINGTFDWVYEEELMDYYADGWRWSPDGRSIAYWQLNADRVRNFDLVNNTDSLYSRVIPVQYPKVGEENSAARVGIVPAAGGATRWLEIEGDPREHYIPRMDWAAGSDEVILQRLNRLQNTDEVMLGDARTGQVRTVLTERDSTWVDVVDDLVWLKGGKAVHLGQRARRVEARVRRLARRQVGAAGDPGRLRRARGQGRRRQGRLALLRRVARQSGPAISLPDPARRQGQGRAHQPGGPSRAPTPTIGSPNFKVAIETYSSLGNPPVIRLVRLPGNQVIRTLVDNAPLRARVAGLRRGPVEWLTIPAAGGARMPGVLMKPADFDSTRRYPLLFFVYGGPGNAEVEDQWGGYWLWHTMLTQKGYLVAIVDNRGTPAPLGRAWRKAIYGQLGVLETRGPGGCGPDARSSGRTSIPAASASGAGATAAFMTLNALFQHPDIYRTGVAVSPVTHWALYDNVYTERFNGLLTTIAEGTTGGRRSAT